MLDYSARVKKDIEYGDTHVSVWHTFCQLCFAEDCSYLQPQMILKDDSGFLEIPQSVFVCFILRLDYWKKEKPTSVVIHY